MLVSIADDNESEEHFVRIAETHVGKGVFATRPYPPTAILGEIKGELIKEPESSSEYTFDYENGWQLEPFEPFRFLNHSCDPNCEFDLLEAAWDEGGTARKGLFVIALREIEPGEELTIAYNWSAESAIECHCQSENCVGWIVCESEIDQVIDLYDNDFEPEYEFHQISYYFPD